MYTARWRALRVDPVRIDVARAERDVKTFVENYLDGRIAQLRMYPAPPAGSTYTRTGKLGLGWRKDVRRTSSEIVGYVWNVATDRRSGRQYMIYVQGSWQTAQHKQTGWQTLDSARQAAQQTYRAGLQAIYSKYIRKTP